MKSVVNPNGSMNLSRMLLEFPDSYFRSRTRFFF